MAKANDGDTDAMNATGLEFKRLGDIESAQYWYRRAAELGDVYATYNLGQIYKSKGLVSEAVGWLEKAVNMGLSEGALSLGNLYTANSDLGTAERWFRIGAEMGQPGAMHNLGRLLWDRDLRSESMEWTRTAAELGHVPAMSKLGSDFLENSDFSNAEVWLSRAANGGDVNVLKALGEICMIQGRFDEAAKWLQEAVEQEIEGANDLLISLLDANADYSVSMITELTFETFGLPQTMKSANLQLWTDGKLSLLENFIESPPDFESLDLDQLRMNFNGGDEKLSIENSVLASIGLKQTAQVLVSQPVDQTGRLELMNIERFNIHHTEALSVQIKQANSDSTIFITTLIILFRECFWTLSIFISIPKVSSSDSHGYYGIDGGETESGDENQPEMKWTHGRQVDSRQLSWISELGGRLRESISFSEKLSGLPEFEER